MNFEDHDEDVRSNLSKGDMMGENGFNIVP